MNRMFVTIAALAAFAPISAFAQERMNDSQFIAASRCIAYVDHSALTNDGLNADALRIAVDANEGRAHANAVSSSEENARDIRRVRARSDAEIQGLRDRRDAACAPFLARGLVQAPGTASAG